jgi:hypothetical protein
MAPRTRNFSGPRLGPKRPLRGGKFFWTRFPTRKDPPALPGALLACWNGGAKTLFLVCVVLCRPRPVRGPGDIRARVSYGVTQGWAGVDSLYPLPSVSTLWEPGP